MATKTTETPARKARKTTTKPAAETPAIETPVNNAEPGVIDSIKYGLDHAAGDGSMRANTSTPGVICYAGPTCPACDYRHELPDVPGVSNIAEVFAASGYFPGKTIAQIATQIIAGRSLAMDPARAMFDLEMSANEIAFKVRRTFEKAADEKAAFDTSIMDALTVDDRTTPKTAASSNVFDMNANPIPIRADESAKYPQLEEKFPELAATIVDLANKGPLLDPNAEGPQGPGPIDETQSAAEARPGEPAISDEPSADPGEVPAEMISTAFGSVGVKVKEPDENDRQRNAFGLLCRELGLDVEAKLKEYDDADDAGKQKKFLDCQKYYAGKVDASRAYVIETLKADGKPTIESQKGFFMYADVGLDPTLWTFTEAAKAQAAIADFFRKPAA